MKASVIREMSSKEIRERIDNEKSAYQKMKMNHVVSNLENPIKLKFARKAIARLSTELTKRESGETVSASSTEAPVKATESKEEAPVEVVEEETEQTGDTTDDEHTDESTKASAEEEETEKA